MSWPSVKAKLKESGQTLDEGITAQGGESETVLEERVINWYSDLIDKHLLKPHEEMNAHTPKVSMSTSSSVHGVSELLKTSIQNSIKKAVESSGAQNGPSPLGRVTLTSANDSVQQTSNYSLHISGNTPPEESLMLQLLAKRLDFSSFGQDSTTSLDISSETNDKHNSEFSSSINSLGSTESGLERQDSIDNIAGKLARMSGLGKRVQMKTNSVLVITHGGWIQKLMKHLVEELGFHVEAETQTGFPKAAGIYRFVIYKVFKDGDYDWEGKLISMNDTSHMAALSQKYQTHVSKNNGVAPKRPKKSFWSSMLSSPKPALKTPSKGSNGSLNSPSGTNSPSGLRKSMFRSGNKDKAKSDQQRSLGW